MKQGNHNDAKVAMMRGSAIPDHPSRGVAGATILVVEDEVLIRLMTADALRAAGFVVIEAANADEALKILKTSEPVDLMLTDIRMPGSIDGVKLALLVRANWPSVKIAIASAHTPQWPASTQVHTFIGKPYNVDRLVQRVRDLLKNEDQ